MHAALEPTADPAWVLEEADVDPFREGDVEARFAIGNGFIGTRAARSISRGPLWTTSMRYLRYAASPRTYIAGLFDIPNIEPAVPVLMPAPDWLRVIIRLDGAPLLLRLGETRLHRRRLDLRRGLLITEWTQTTPSGITVRLRSLRLASQADRGLGLQLVHLDIDRAGVAVELDAIFDLAATGLDPLALADDCGTWRTDQSGRRLAMAGAAALRLGDHDHPPAQRSPLRWSWTWTSRAGQPIALHRLMAATRADPGRPDPAHASLARIGIARACGWPGVLAAHEASWAARWRSSDIEIDGDDDAQRILRFAAYHLLSTANPDDPLVSIGARALSGDGYLGHVFWDTEIYLLPFYTATWPEAARALLMYRFHTLDGARAKAAAKGWRGALYAWESTDTGYETTPDTVLGPGGTPVEVLSGKLEQHISADIAYAVWHHWRITGDTGFLREAGAEILLETARFWASRAVLEADGFHHIRSVIGPDEYHEDVDDNAFTNLMARWTIARGLDAADLLQSCWPEDWARLALPEAERAAWRNVAATMFTGQDPASGLFEQFAGFHALETIDLAAFAQRTQPMDVVLPRERVHGAQILKQADVVALLALLPEAFTAAEHAVNFTHYAARCAHDSSLSHSMHALAAARMGDPAAALRHFRDSAAIDLSRIPGRLSDGIHIASLGGLWQVATLGFAGISAAGRLLSCTPRLPPDWRAMALRTQWRGREVHLRITHDTLTATLERGPGMPIAVNGTSHDLVPGVALQVRLAPGALGRNGQNV